ncbi:unnamed protein product [Cercospora beticola]|nr:unnamed protein product [Cercospora beticola]
MGFCEQDPALLGGTIMDNIVEFTAFDQHLYHDITCAVMLREDFRQMEHGDQTDIGSNGANLSGGQRKRVALARALYQSTCIYILDEILGGLDSKTAQHVFDNVLGPEGLLKRRGATAVFATSSRQYLHAADHVIHLTRTPDPPCDARGTLNDANIAESVPRDALSSQQASSTQVPCDSSPGSLAFVDEAHRIHAECRRSTIEKPSDVLNEKEDDDSRYASSTLSEAASKQTSAADNNLLFYAYYLRASGKVPLVLFICSALVYAFCSNFSTAWLSFWRRTASRSRSLFILAPLRLFSGMNQGEITTLFSQDLNIIDSELPQAAMNAVLNTVVAIGVTAVLAIASPYILISLPVILLVLWIVQRVYLHTARRLRVLDLEAKEPLYTHFLATVRSISTIRAFCWQRHFVKLNSGMIETSQRAAYVLAMVQRWLDYVLGMVVAGMATIPVALAVILRSDAAITGASLLSLLSLGEALSAVVEFSSRMDIAMGTVGRLRAFASGAQIKEEGHGDEIESCWPSRGEIAVRSVSASYDDADSTMKKRRPSEHRRHSHLALHDVTFSVPAACKVAIVGRSGSGKSTLFRLLLRLLDPLPSTSHRESTILVDNVPLSLIPRSLVRERIIAIPQRSVPLPDSSFRQNIDPYNQCSQECCLEALDVVGLADPVRNRGGLDSKVSADMLSHGELQSLGLARALLRKKQADERRAKAAARFHATTEKLDTAAAAAMVGQGARASGGILLVDEVGSALDAEMYDRLWKIIRREFQSYTVVAILHRLDPVALEFFDRVLVMERGELVEGGGECPSEF